MHSLSSISRQTLCICASSVCAIFFIHATLRVLGELYTVFKKKTCDHVFEDKLNWNCPFTTFFGTLITKSVGHRQMFSHLTYFTLGNCQDLNIIKKITRNHENFTGTCDSDYKSLSVNAVWCTKTVEWIGRQELETWKHRQSVEENPQDGFNCLVTRQRKTAFVTYLPCAQSGRQAKKAPISPWDFAWNCHSLLKLYRIIHRDLQLKCFTRCRAQLLSEATRITRLTH